LKLVKDETKQKTFNKYSISYWSLDEKVPLQVFEHHIEEGEKFVSLSFSGDHKTCVVTVKEAKDIKDN
jgi:hypothetical protein